MDSDLAHDRALRPWSLRVANWVAACALVVVLLALSLHRRANPWQLQLVLPSGLDETKYTGYFRDDAGNTPASLSPDGRLLAVGRPSGQCEIWNLDALRREAVVGDALPATQDDHPGTSGVYDVRWLSDGQHIAMDRRSNWDVFSLDGRRTAFAADLRDHDRGAAPSPVGRMLACIDVDDLIVSDAATGSTRCQWKLQYVNSGDRRMDWTPDARYLLLNDHLGVRVFDVQAGRLAYFHRELDLSLPTPMIADEHSGIEAFEKRREESRPSTQVSTNDGSGPTHLSMLLAGRAGRNAFCTLVDSRFAPGGSYFATLYRPDDMLFPGSGNPQGNRLRFYDTLSGKLLWDTVLTGQPRSTAFFAGRISALCRGGEPRHVALGVAGRRHPTPATDRESVSPVRRVHVRCSAAAG